MLNNKVFSIIPKPVSMKVFDGIISLAEFKNIILKHDNSQTLLIAQKIQLLLKKNIPILTGSNQNLFKKNIILEINNDLEIKKEGYFLSISKNQILMQAQNDAGLFYAFQSFRQILPSYIEQSGFVEEIYLPLLEINDFPRFGYRGMHLDVSRHFFSVDFIKTYIDMIALHKMNIFHWHLTDDNGWRIEIDHYPKLTQRSAWRVDREHEKWTKWSPIHKNEKCTYGGYYTKKEIKDIIDYAEQRYITIIPEIEMPGHTVEVFASYPELSCKGKKLNVVPGSYWPNIDILCAGNENVFEFLENVLSEIIELFPGDFIHIGGDEVDKTFWKNCPKCQKRINDEGLNSEIELQSWFIRRIQKFLIKNDKKLIGWDEILEGGLDHDATVMVWRNKKFAVESLKQGHEIIMCPTSHCYFDYYQADPKFEPESIGGFTTLEKVYSFNPIPKNLTADEENLILGGQANLWTEYVKTNTRAQYQVLPRMTALSEVLWSPSKLQDYSDFYKRLNNLQKRFKKLDWTYASSEIV